MNNAPEVKQLQVDDHTLAVQYGVRDGSDGPEHVVTVPGTDIVVTGASEQAVLEAAVGEIREHVAARREESERLAAEAQGKNGAVHTEVDGQPAKVVMNGTTGAPAANTTKAEREAEAQRLIDVPLEELARTLASLDAEAEPHTKHKALAENALNKITQRRKVVIAEINRRGHNLMERDLGKHEFDMR